MTGKSRKSRSKKGLSPAISSVIITATIIALVTVAVVFANNFLSARVAEGDFNSAKQFMQTIGLQIDDVAWKIGQRETMRYSSRYGVINAMNGTLNYKIEVKTTGSYWTFSENSTGIIYFNMPTSVYTIANNWYRLVWPSQISNLTLWGSSAPSSKVFEAEKIPMSDGNFVRVVTAPMIRVINSTIITGTNSTFYYKLYLPLVSLKSAPRLAQSVTLTGDSISMKTQNHITSIRITLTFPKAANGFDNTFFNFPVLQQVINMPVGYSDYVIELYMGTVTTQLGANP